jgi:hypothetical protein
MITAGGIDTDEKMAEAMGIPPANDQGSNDSSDPTKRVLSQVITTTAINVGEKAAEAISGDATNDQGRANAEGGSASVQSVSEVHTPSGEESYYKQAEELKEEHPDWTMEQITNKMSEIIWNNDYNALINDIAHSKTPEEREQKIREHRAELDKYEASGIKVANDIKYLRDKQGMGSVVLSEAELYEQEILIIKEEHPGWTGAQAAEEYARKLKVWADRYQNVLSDIRQSDSAYQLQQKINYYENNGELQQFRDSGLDVDSEISKIKVGYGKNKVTLWNKWISDYSYSGVSGEYAVDPTSPANADPDSIPKVEGNIEWEYNEYDTYWQVNPAGTPTLDAMQIIHYKKQQFDAYVREFSEGLEKLNNILFRRPLLTNADLESGYVLIPMIDGLTYVRARNVNGYWEIDPNDEQLYKESHEALVKDTIQNALLGGAGQVLSKMAGAGGKSLSKVLTNGPSKDNIYEEFNKITTPKARYEYLLDKANSLDVSTERNKAIFYSGLIKTENGTIRARQIAERYVDKLYKEKGIVKLTLERTPGGEWMDDLGLYTKGESGLFKYEELGLTSTQTDELWRTLSSRYANGASGAITAFAKNVPDFIKPQTIFWDTEFSVLRSNPKVTDINIR